MSEIFNKEYFTSINYTDYLSRYNRYQQLARETTRLLEYISLINKNTSILDYGCAVGFLGRALKELGYENYTGYDISEWALNETKNANLRTLDIYKYYQDWDIVFCLDVLEHMSDNDIKKLFYNINTTTLIVRIPVAEYGESNFHLEVSRRDPTHINCKTSWEWEKILRSFGFNCFLPLNLYTIYSSPGVYSAICIKN